MILTGILQINVLWLATDGLVYNYAILQQGENHTVGLLIDSSWNDTSHQENDTSGEILVQQFVTTMIASI